MSSLEHDNWSSVDEDREHWSSVDDLPLIQRAPVTEEKPQPHITHQPSHKELAFFRVVVGICSVLLVSVALYHIWSGGQHVEMKKEYKKLEKKEAKLKKKQIELQNELEKLRDLARISKIAKRLGMRPPNPRNKFLLLAQQKQPTKPAPPKAPPKKN